MNKDLSLKSEKINFVFPTNLFTPENMKELSLYLDTLNINATDFSKGYINAKGVETPDNKRRLEESLAKIFQKSEFGEEYYLDFDIPNYQYYLRMRNSIITSTLGNNSYEVFLRYCLYEKAKSFDLTVNPTRETIFGIEELQNRYPQQYKQLNDFLNNRVSKQLYGIKIESK